VFPCFRDPKPLHGEEYNGQGELNGRVEHKSAEFDKSVVLWRGGGGFSAHGWQLTTDKSYARIDSTRPIATTG
jgi:hypothetical protein